MNGAVPRHVSHSELRERLRELSSRSAPLLRRVRVRPRGGWMLPVAVDDNCRSSFMSC